MGDLKERKIKLEVTLIEQENRNQVPITYITRKYPNAKVVGLCHGYNAVYKIAEMLGLEKEHMKFEISGVSHFVWLTHFTYKGEELYSGVLKN